MRPRLVTTSAYVRLTGTGCEFSGDRWTSCGMDVHVESCGMDVRGGSCGMDVRWGSCGTGAPSVGCLGGRPRWGGCATWAGRDWSRWAGFNRSMETVSDVFLNRMVTYLGAQSITSKGPSYGFWRGDHRASRLTNTNFVFWRASDTSVWMCFSP